MINSIWFVSLTTSLTVYIVFNSPGISQFPACAECRNSKIIMQWGRTHDYVVDSELLQHIMHVCYCLNKERIELNATMDLLQREYRTD